jgi:hypothetical protein
MTACSDVVLDTSRLVGFDASVLAGGSPCAQNETRTLAFLAPMLHF